MYTLFDHLLASVENFLFGLNELFRGDVRDPSSERDEWYLSDMAFLEAIILPAARMSLKLHQV